MAAAVEELRQAVAGQAAARQLEVVMGQAVEMGEPVAGQAAARQLGAVADRAAAVAVFWAQA